MKHHNQFKKGLSKFFLDFLQKLVFKDTRSPHPEIISQLMKFVVFKSMKNSDSKITTKVLSPFENDDIDPQPVVRSLILQLLLKSDFNLARDHLTYFFREAQFNGHIEVELCLLMVNCFEDHLKIRARNDAILYD